MIKIGGIVNRTGKMITKNGAEVSHTVNEATNKVEELKQSLKQIEKEIKRRQFINSQGGSIKVHDKWEEMLNIHKQLMEELKPTVSEGFYKKASACHSINDLEQLVLGATTPEESTYIVAKLDNLSTLMVNESDIRRIIKLAQMPTQEERKVYLQRRSQEMDALRAMLGI